MTLRSSASSKFHVRRTVLGAALVLAGTLGLTSGALAQAYPQKSIKLVVNSAPGGLTDVLARLIGNKMAIALGQSVVVDNKPGGAGLIGAEAVSKADPDGYTIGLMASAITVSPALVAGATFDASKDIAPIGLAVSAPMVMVTAMNSPYKTVADVVADAKGKPGQIAIASGGAGTMTHLLSEQFQAVAGLDMIHVPYKGGAPALQATLAGQVPVYFDTLSTSTKLIQEKRLRGLAIVLPKRSPAVPDVPTIGEAGLPAVQGSAWFAFIAPAHTPANIVARLNDEMNKALSSPDIKERIVSLGGAVEGGTPKELADLIASEKPRWTKLVKDRNIKM